MMRNSLQIALLAIMLTLLAGIAFAQTADAAPETGQTAASAIAPSGSPRAESLPPSLPQETAPRRFIELGLNAAAAYDNNGSFVTGNQAAFVTGISPVFRVNDSASRYDLQLEYKPGLTRTTGLASRDDFNQGFHGRVAFKLSRRWTLHLANDFVVTSNPFESALTPTAESPNATIATPFVRRKSEIASAELGYRLSARTSVGFVGNFSMRRYNDPSGFNNRNQQLLDASTASGRAYIAHRFTKTVTGGVEYSYQDLLIGQGTSRTQTHAAVAFTKLRFGAHSELSGFIGPERSHLRDVSEIDLGLFIITIPTDEWRTSFTSGATYSWADKRDRFTTSYNRRISDGGGLIGVVRLQSVSANFERRLARDLIASADFSYGHNSALGVDHKLEFYNWGANLSHKFSRNFNVRTRYGHTQQVGKSVLINNNHNRFSVSLEYVWTHPLGRNQ